MSSIYLVEWYGLYTHHLNHGDTVLQTPFSLKRFLGFYVSTCVGCKMPLEGNFQFAIQLCRRLFCCLMERVTDLFGLQLDLEWSKFQVFLRTAMLVKRWDTRAKCCQFIKKNERKDLYWFQCQFKCDFYLKPKKKKKKKILLLKY